VLLVGNHALDVVDPLLLLATVFRKLHRTPRFIGHENGWFRVPVLRDISARFNVIPSRRPEEAVAALRRDGFFMLYPGSVREAGMRSYRDEPYRLRWEGRSGFLRLALDAEADVVFVAALGNDEAYYQSGLPDARRADPPG
jgi:acyltransferase-like protein